MNNEENTGKKITGQDYAQLGQQDEGKTMSSDISSDMPSDMPSALTENHSCRACDAHKEHGAHERALHEPYDGHKTHEGRKGHKERKKGGAGRRAAFFFTVLVEILVLAFLLLSVVRTPNEMQTIPYQDIVGTTIPDERDGWYVDSTFPLSDDGLFDYTEDQKMRPGVYEITLNYETDTDLNYTTVRASTKSPGALLADNFHLPAKLTHVTFTVWLLNSSDDFSVRNYYTGSGYLIIRDITIVRTNRLERITFFSALVLFMLLDLVVIERLRAGSFIAFLYRRRMALLLIVAALVVSMPMLDGGITSGDDYGFHLTRIEGLAKSFRDGIIPCKLQTNWAYGYGYAVSLYYGDLFLTIPAILRLIGFTAEFSYNVLIFCANLVSACTAYYCTRKISGERIFAYCCSFLYLASPYSLLGIYYRNALGEAQARAFLPLIVYGLFVILTSDTKSTSYRRSWVPLVIGLSGIIESHMLTCVITGEFMVLLFLFSLKRVFEKRRFFMLLKSAILTILLNAWFIVPMLLSYHNLAMQQPYKSTLRIQQYGTKLRDLFSWTFGRDLAGVTELSFGLETDTYSVGTVCGIVLIAFLLLYVRDHSPSGRGIIPRYTMYFWWFSVLGLFMSTKYFPWDYISDLLGRYAYFVTNVQFAQRYLTVPAALSPFICCFMLMALKAYGSGDAADRGKDTARAAITDAAADTAGSYAAVWGSTPGEHADPSATAATSGLLGLSFADPAEGAVSGALRAGKTQSAQGQGGTGIAAISAAALIVLAFLAVWPQLTGLPVIRIYNADKFGRTDYNMAEYLYNRDVEYTSDDYMAHKVDPQYDYVPGKITAGDGISYKDFSQSGTTAHITCTNDSEKESFLELPILYYEQYHAEDDAGQALEVTPGTINVVRITIPQGFSGRITLTYDYPLSWQIAEWVSLIAFIGVIALAAAEEKKRKGKFAAGKEGGSPRYGKKTVT